MDSEKMAELASELVNTLRESGILNSEEMSELDDLENTFKKKLSLLAFGAEELASIPDGVLDLMQESQSMEAADELMTFGFSVHDPEFFSMALILAFWSGYSMRPDGDELAGDLFRGAGE